MMRDEGRVVPVIDMQELPFPYAKLREACQEWGCFRVMNHGVPVLLMSEMKRVARSLLDLPIETKNQNVEVTPGTAYIALGKVNSIYESLCLSDLNSPDAMQTFFSQLDVCPKHREVMETYSRATLVLVMDIANKLAKSLGLSDGSDLFKGWPCNMRMNKYSFNPETVGSCGIPMHTDGTFLTLLQDDDVVGGLEVVDSKPDSFVAVEPCPNTFFVLVGDLAVAWSNGRLSSAKHQVQCIEGRIRVSIGTFMSTPTYVAVEAPEEFVDPLNPRLYVPFTRDDYANLRRDKKMYTDEALSFLLARS
ncbi:2-oxoglutarate-dependent dioxygenase DAO-like [Punica granatum]|uniref:2-oxoglutarate-dependent dioxygenase DAO-like n=1 Tax=Punica granatum TaxID=22663 RepID=A0A218W2J1_PUNGR|nr:2-oxoglutarate-dependent dioxygenase DAO-like [Punica granatum]OWM66520.1 hypothetical protein CDL15_Pgr013737 [Punica granatum]